MQVASRLIIMLTLTVLGQISLASNYIVEKIEKDLAPFEKVILNGNFNVTLIQGEGEHIIVAGKKQSLAELEVLQRGRTVIVQPIDKHRVKAVKKVEITLYLKTISKLELNGISGLVCATPLRSDHLRLDCNGIRDLELHLEIGALDAVFNGIGTAYLYGRAEEASIEYTGIGNLEAFDLVTERLNLESTGIGRVEVHAVAELSVVASGIGSVRYLGNPAITDLDGSGIGKIKRVKS